MGLKSCVECGETVSEDAKNCPHCGKKDPTETIGDKIGEFITGVVIFSVIVWWSPWSSNDEAAIKNYPVSNATYSQVDYEVGCKSKDSDDKKENVFNTKYKNHKMRWAGSIDLVESDEVSLNLDGKGTQDIQIDFLNSKAGYDLKKRQYITVEFVMDSMGGCFLPFGGINGVVIE